MRKRRTWMLWLSAVVLVSLMVVPLGAEDSKKININTASADELASLDRVGAAYAARIIEYREKNGPFQTPEDVTKVPGIGPKIFELNKDRIVVE